MAIIIDRITKNIETLDTVEALANQARWLVYHKRTPSPEVYACPRQYRVIEGEDVRVATEAERVTIDTEIAAAIAAETAAAIAQRRAAAKAFLSSLDDSTVIALRALIVLFTREINRLRTNPTTVYPAFTAAQVIAALEAEIDGLT